MPTLTIEDQVIYYRVVGSGQSVVLMHGWTETGDDMRPIAEALPNYQFILPDLPGYGQSVPPVRSYPPDFYARDARLMAGFLAKVLIDQPAAHIMGFSDGGEVALLLPMLAPALCRSVIAWGAIGAFGPEACERSRRGLPPTWITDAIRARHPGQNVDEWPYQWVDAFCAMIANGGDISLSRAGSHDRPLLLMLGDQDGLNPVAGGETYVRAAQHGALRVFPGAGHAIHEQQFEAFIATIRAFWESL